MRVLLVLFMILNVSGSVNADDGLELPKPPPGTKRTFLGFRLTRIDSGSIYATVGLREGDLLTSLNGRPVRSGGDLEELPALLKRNRQVELKVERGNRKVTLRYRLKASKKRVPADAAAPATRARTGESPSPASLSD